MLKNRRGFSLYLIDLILIFNIFVIFNSGFFELVPRVGLLFKFSLIFNKV